MANLLTTTPRLIKGVIMSAKQQAISRRKLFSFLGVAVASSLAVPAAVISVSNAEAAVGDPTSAASVAGMNRRDRRRDRRNKKKKKK
jgi:hypothetical protein